MTPGIKLVSPAEVVRTNHDQLLAALQRILTETNLAIDQNLKHITGVVPSAAIGAIEHDQGNYQANDRYHKLWVMNLLIARGYH